MVMNKMWLRELTAGFTTFFAMSYIMFVNPSILQPLGMDPGAVFVWTCFTAAAASVAAAVFLNVPTALACGMSLNTFILTFARDFNVPWPFLLFVCGVASLLVFRLSVGSFRQDLINAIPDQIFAAIKGGIGGMLVRVALTETAVFAAPSPEGAGLWQAFLLFAAGLAVILGIKLLCAKLMVKFGESKYLVYAEFLESSGYLLSILVLWIIIYLFIGETYSQAPMGSQINKTHILFTWQELFQGERQQLLFENPQNWITSFVFGLAVLFVMLTDVAGSPIDYVRQGYLNGLMTNTAAKDNDRRKASLIRRSLRIDSLFNIVAAAVGVSPIVYYAENHAGWQAGGRTGRTVGLVAVLFALCGFGGIALIYLDRPIVEFIPRFVVMPALFFVGLTIVAESFATRLLSIEPGAQSTGAVASAQPREPTAIGRTLYFMPAAITTILATRLTLDAAIAAGILAYLLITQFPESYLGIRGKGSRELSFIYFGAAVVLGLTLYIQLKAPPPQSITLGPQICEAVIKGQPFKPEDRSAIVAACSAGSRKSP
jgi:adenine/guanine/hypoxanthine permease